MGIFDFKHKVTEAEIEEERRMFFVAMTRAKEKLFLFYVKTQEKEKVKKTKLITYQILIIFVLWEQM